MIPTTAPTTASRLIRATTLLAVAAAVALTAGRLHGAFASWHTTATATASATTAGALKIDLATSGTGRLSDGFGSTHEPAAPGDTQTRYVTLTNSGQTDAANITVTANATGDPTLIAALTLSIDVCDNGTWDTDGTCSGTPRNIVSEPGSTAKTIAATLTTAGTIPLKITRGLSDSAPTDAAGKTASLSYEFHADQRAGEQR